MRYLILLAVTLLMTLPGIWALPPIDRDEARYLQASRQMVETGDYVDIRLQEQSRYKKPIGIYWLQSAAVNLSGKGADAPIWVYRLVSVLGAVLAVFGTCWTGTRLFGPTAGLVAGLVLAGTFGMVFEGHIAKTDAMLLAFAVTAQGALAQVYVRSREREPVPLHLFWVFWIAQGLAILIKGPIAPLLSVLTVAALYAVERDWRWIGKLRILPGLAVVALIVLPWLVAITWRSGLAFWQESVGNDLLGKVAQVQESHGAPPGYYVLTYGLYMWPFGVLVLGPGLMAMRKARSDPRLLFLLCWYIPFWFFFELLPTKLPHYVVPAYPALALMAGWGAATAIDFSAVALWRWQRWLYWAAIIGQIIVSAGLAALAILGPIYLGSGGSGAGIAAGIAALAAGYFAFPRNGQVDMRRIVYAVISSAVAFGLMFTFVAPSFQRIFLSPRIATAFEANRPCPQSTLASAGYHEPSLVFLTETDTLLTNVGGAADHLLSDPACALAVLPSRDAGELIQIVEAEGRSLSLVAEIGGLNYSNGQDLLMRMYRIAP